MAGAGACWGQGSGSRGGSRGTVDHPRDIESAEVRGSRQKMGWSRCRADGRHVARSMVWLVGRTSAAATRRGG